MAKGNKVKEFRGRSRGTNHLFIFVTSILIASIFFASSTVSVLLNISIRIPLTFSCQKFFAFKSKLERVQTCSIKNFQKDPYFLNNTEPITSKEFVDRRDKLAKALHISGVDGFVLEPGYTFQYYGNISQRDWEPWEPEERPFLMIVQPEINNASGEIVAKTSFLSPHFEEGRVRMLGIPCYGELDIIVWEEHWNPYSTLKKELFPERENTIVMVDEEMRDFIVRGLESNGFKTVGLGGEVEAVRQIKTPAEVELLRTVNTGTVEAIRAMRPCLEPGLTENEVTKILDKTLLSIGFQLFFNIVLFDSNAALPHGGFATGDMILTYETMVLIDVGAHYLGYSSDVCRSFFIDPPEGSWVSSLLTIFGSVGERYIKTAERRRLHLEKLKVWEVVLEAQTQAGKMFKSNNTAASVDIAARTVIDDAGYKGAFTHRLGHGIGIKGQSAPSNSGQYKY
jgi:Xaa-Pro aminopeptidase